MFGFLAHIPPPQERPKVVPPPTPVHFPQYAPELLAGHGPHEPHHGPQHGPAQDTTQRITDMLQNIVRMPDIRVAHFAAFGVRITTDAPPDAVVPGWADVAPDFAAWDETEYDRARDTNERTRRPLTNGGRAPGIQVYLDRTRELSVPNAAAYRTVRRLPPVPGTKPVRLGNAYEFYRHLESMAAFWDDTSVAKAEAEAAQATDDVPVHGASFASLASLASQASSNAVVSDDSQPSDEVEAEKEAETEVETERTKPPESIAFRTMAGNQMPPEIRTNMTIAFLKLVAYDFGCNVAAARVEPRLYLNNPPVTPNDAVRADAQHRAIQTYAQERVQARANNDKDKEPGDAPPPVDPSPAHGPVSYFQSGCMFVYRSPTTREAARAMIVEGPLAAVSARHATSFLSPDAVADLASPDADRDAVADLARELVTALVTAQHRAREGRAERRPGLGQWWATRPRWGGGTGGPIGRESEHAPAPNTDEPLDVLGDTPTAAPKTPSAVLGMAPDTDSANARPSARDIFASIGAGAPGSRPTMPPLSKRPRKGMTLYDNYRMVRPPSASWDKKTRYLALGRAPGAAYDDIYVVSSLFHHVSLVRVRVPLRLLDELDGLDVDADADADAALRGLEVVRSPWFDFFLVEDRLAAMRLVWGMMASLTQVPGDGDGAGVGVGDVPMGDA